MPYPLPPRVRLPPGVFPLIRIPAKKDLGRDSLHFAVTTILAALGGAAFAALGLPVPWISGSMLFVAIAAFAGAPMLIPRWLREIVFFFLGINVGAAVTPETLGGIATWPASIAIMIVGLPILSLACVLPLVYWRGWTRDDAMLASVPGALSLIMALADATDADVPRIALVQALRVAILVAIVPPLISLTAGVDLAVPLPDRALPGPVETALLVVSGLVLAYLIRLTGFPAAGLMGGLIASAALHATGAVHTVMPNEILMVSFIILGAGIGARFAGLGWQRLRGGLFDALLTFVIGFLISLVMAFVATELLGFPFGQTVLAFAPGALEVMAVMAFLLGMDVAYVGAHHTVRFVVLVLLAPVLFRRRPGRTSP